ncbi:MAG TPA: DUF3108 domain-containing protein [Flavobacteriales bacterium]|nr:DUF3108 domain-containing protein [Flavobacteriales bacterium]
MEQKPNAMKNLALLLILICSVNGYAFEGVAARQNQQTTFRKIKNESFKAGEKLVYKVHYGLVDAGFATLEVKETTKNINGRKLLHVVGKGKSISAFDLFFKVRDRYESYIDQEGMFPWIFIRRVYEGGFEIKQDYTFYQHKKKVITGKDKLDVPANVQDMLSSFYYARTIDFSNAKIDDEFEINCVVDGETWPLKIKYKGEDVVKIKKGKFNCLKFAPVLQEGRIWENEEDLTVWITNDQNKIPLLAKTKILVGSIKMELCEYEGLAGPISKI